MTTYYIDPAGNDSLPGNGSSGNPWLTVSKFVSSSVPGDTLIVNDGTYTHSGKYQITGRTIQAQNSGQVLFDGGATNNYNWRGGGTITITGINFTNYLTAEYAPFGSNNEGGGVGDWTFNNCRFYNCTLRNDSFSGGLIHSSFIDGASYTLNNCRINDIQHDGSAGNLSAIFSFVFTNTFTIKNCNIIFDASTNNVIYLFNSQSNNKYTVTVKNSIIANLSGGTVTFSRNTLLSETYQYSCFYSMTAGSAVLSGTGLITSDPLFIDAANNNFNLRPTSPCIDAGVIV